MNVLAANLTVVALLVHAVAGCCWHHDHVPSVEHAPSAVKPVVSGGHFCWHDDHEHDEHKGGAPGHHHGEGGCHHGKCSFAAQYLRPQVDSPSMASGVLAVPSIAVEQARFIAHLDDRSSRPCGPPLALHLLHCVILI